MSVLLSSQSAGGQSSPLSNTRPGGIHKLPTSKKTAAPRFFSIAKIRSVFIVELVEDYKLTANEKVALLSLLDDPSPVVRRELLRFLDRIGSRGSEILREAAQGSNRLLGWHANQYLADLQSANPVQELRAFIQSFHYELESGWIMISRVAYPNLEVGEIYAALDAIADRCSELIAQPATPRDQCRVVNRVLFHELGFRGNSEHYNDPDNSFINRVLETKKGLPITLSLLYLLVSERLGIPLEPISAPGHFVVGCFEETAPFYIDPFERGKILTAGHMLERIQTATLHPQVGQLAPASTYETLSRVCRNLVPHFAESGEESMSSLFRSFLQDFREAYEKRV